jgi:hypothetical protein
VVGGEDKPKTMNQVQIKKALVSKGQNLKLDYVSIKKEAVSSITRQR